MKRFTLLTLVSLFFLVSCNNSTEEGNESTQQDTVQKEVDPNSAKAHFASLGESAASIGPNKSAVQEEVEDIHTRIAKSDNPYVGYWVGKFGRNMINIILSDVEDGQASGYSVCAGNYRKLTGTYKEDTDNVYDFVLEEPGDDKYDGEFDFTIDLNKQSLKGTWTPFQSKGNSAKNYTLAKRAFKYNIDNGDYSFASERDLTHADVENRTEEELRIMRSEIYARHGYSFKEKDMRYYFEDKDWYMPMFTDIREQLSEIEEMNIELIYEYETYYDEYYDEYGR